MKTIIIEKHDNLGRLAILAFNTSEDLKVGDKLKIVESLSNNNSRNTVNYTVNQVLSKHFMYLTASGDLLEEFTNINSNKINTLKLSGDYENGVVFAQKLD